MFTGPVAGDGQRGFHSNSVRFTAIVNSGASDHMIDDELIINLRGSMRYFERLKESKTIATAGNAKVFATATGTIRRMGAHNRPC